MAKTREQKSFEVWALPKLKKLQKIMLLQHFSPLEIEFYKSTDTYAECSNQYPYQSIIIRISDKMLEDFKKKSEHKSIIGTLVHEMCHPLTDPLFNIGYERFVTKDQLKNEREKLTDHIGNIILENQLI